MTTGQCSHTALNPAFLSAPIWTPVLIECTCSRFTESPNQQPRDSNEAAVGVNVEGWASGAPSGLSTDLSMTDWTASARIAAALVFASL